MKKLLHGLLILTGLTAFLSLSSLIKLPQHYGSSELLLPEQTNWTEEEMRIVHQFNLRIDDGRGISLVSPELGNDVQQPDAVVGTVKEALVLFMTTGLKKDLMYVRVADIAVIPVDYRRILDIHDVVRLYLILENK